MCAFLELVVVVYYCYQAKNQFSSSKDERETEGKRQRSWISRYSVRYENSSRTSASLSNLYQSLHEIWQWRSGYYAHCKSTRSFIFKMSSSQSLSLACKLGTNIRSYGAHDIIISSITLIINEFTIILLL